MPAAAAAAPGGSLKFCTICIILYACFSIKRTIPNIYSSAKLSFHHLLHISFVPLHIYTTTSYNILPKKLSVIVPKNVSN